MKTEDLLRAAPAAARPRIDDELLAVIASRPRRCAAPNQ